VKSKIAPGSSVHLDHFHPDDTSLVKGGKSAAAEKGEKILQRLNDLQEMLYAGQEQRVLIVLQGMDTSGKDGTIRYLMRGFNAQGVRIVSFKKPTEAELAHDFLWRIHAQVPGNGEVTLFNRSHYEDVLVVRVHELVKEKTWRARYQQINDFEQMLSENGTLILKFFLHISKEEQRERLEERIQDPTKRWKFQHGDLEERKLWDDYIKAYEDALEQTSTKWAPWYIVPANHKWFRNYLVASTVAKQLERLDLHFPEPDLSHEVVD
jgi:PPK2 family polyphosphate:nucleotide phosphotransferase